MVDGGGELEHGRVTTRAGDKILVHAGGVCPPYGHLDHHCTGHGFILKLAYSYTREELDPVALGVCRYCGERLPT